MPDAAEICASPNAVVTNSRELKNTFWLIASVPPWKVTVPPASPRLPSLEMLSVPSLIVVPPEWVLAPARVSVPASDSTTLTRRSVAQSEQHERAAADSRALTVVVVSAEGERAGADLGQLAVAAECCSDWATERRVSVVESDA